MKIFEKDNLLLEVQSVRHKFTLGLAAAVTFVMLFFSLALITYNSRSVEKDLSKQLDILSAFSGKSLSIALWQYNYDFITEYTESLFLYEDVVFAAIVVKDEEIEKKVRLGIDKPSFQDLAASSRFISAQTDILYKGVVVGAIQLVLSRERVNTLVISTSSLLILILLLINLTVFGTNYIMSTRFLFEPLARLETSVKAISAGNLDVAIDTGSSDEIGQLARSFKLMMENLKKITASRDELDHEIRERKSAERKLHASLKEKEVLFKEIHHRVKNNMQIIQSLLSLQVNEIDEAELKKPLLDSSNRINSMALIHEVLYRSDDMAILDVKTYFSEIVQHLFHIYLKPGDEVTLHLDVAPTELEMDLNIACGLIINELVSNTLKHGQVSGSQGNISISLHTLSENEGSLVVSDNGPGLPADLDLNALSSLGLKIVDILVKGQLKGSMFARNDNGAVFEIFFPLSKKK